ncbi:MAG: methyltransferase domain-containing protein [Sphingobacteriales bacterium]|nr:methyltransferase domain-containing protein [Sphingobacteriales bacterium]
MNETAVIENTVATGSFEESYIRMRQKEGRIYTDEELLQLPDISSGHRYYKEWLLRKKSCTRLKKYIEKKIRSVKILEMGCGNGWLSHCLSQIPGSEVTGADINRIELQQAKRVFKNVPNLQFVPGGINAAGIPDAYFDFVIFASCIQYFASLEELVRDAMRKLKDSGELHILDSPFYKPVETTAAAERTKEYFDRMGFPQMADSYHHHSLDELKQFDCKILYQPNFISRYLYRNKTPFPWICIKKS